MAKINTSGIIQRIRGKLGDLIFSSWKGIPIVKRKAKRIRQANSKSQVIVKATFGQLSKKWRKLSFVQRAVWEDYAKQISNKKHTGVTARIIRGGKREAMSGMNAYVGVNAMLTLCGFPSVEAPPNKSIPKPLLPSTDLPIYSQFNNEAIKFKIWLHRPNPCKCRARIYIRVIKKGEEPYTAEISEISTTPTEIVIPKIRLHRRRKIVEVPINKIKELELELQMRTIVNNGNYSMPSPIYKIGLSNTD